MAAALCVLISLGLVGGTAALTRSTVGLSRRGMVALMPSAVAVAFARPVFAAEDKQALLAELKDAAERLKPLSAMLDAENWDGVRTVLKSPPVGNLWNLGTSRNTIRKLAAARDNDVELVEYVDTVSGALQLADQFTYDNVFVYTQPGNGKIKLKEPKDQIKLAMKLLNEAIELASQ